MFGDFCFYGFAVPCWRSPFVSSRSTSNGASICTISIDVWVAIWKHIHKVISCFRLKNCVQNYTYICGTKIFANNRYDLSTGAKIRPDFICFLWCPHMYKQTKWTQMITLMQILLKIVLEEIWRKIAQHLLPFYFYTEMQEILAIGMAITPNLNYFYLTQNCISKQGVLCSNCSFQIT